MELSELRQIAAWLAAADIRRIEIDRPGESMRMTVTGHDQALVQAVKVVDEDGGVPSPRAKIAPTAVVAESVGMFLATHPMRSSPFVRPGVVVKKGDIVGLLRITRIYAPVTAPVDGVVTQVLAAHEALVGFGTRLLDIQPGHSAAAEATTEC